MPNNARRAGAVVEAHSQLLLWLALTVEKSPKTQKTMTP
jgi:hypothetical protein